MKLITTQEQVYANMDRLNHELAISQQLADRLGLVHAWYVDARDPSFPKFGFSKFIGYVGLDHGSYLAQYKNLNGRNTEWALKQFADELTMDSPQYDEYHQKLADWLSDFGKSPRNPVRLMILKSNTLHSETPEDRRLLELVLAVVDLLPLHQRHELRSRI